MKKDLSLRLRSLLAALSGVGVALVMLLDLDTVSGFAGAVFYGLSGLCFAAGVLFPYVKKDRFTFLRAGALALASALSYWAAIDTAIDGPWSGGGQFLGVPASDIVAYTSASIVGVAIVLIGLVPIAPVRPSVSFFLYCLGAALLGGLVTSITLHRGSFLIMTTGYVAWHYLVFLAINFGTRHERAAYQAIP